VNRNVMITCALTGAGDTVGRSEHVPVTPEQIAESGIAAARAGATIVHIHVRDPQTGKGSREVAYYREVVERIRASDVDVVYIAGYGFPRYRGGPMLHADLLGLPRVVSTMRDFAALPRADTNFWQPAALLQRLATEGGKLSS